MDVIDMGAVPKKDRKKSSNTASPDVWFLYFNDDRYQIDMYAIQNFEMKCVSRCSRATFEDINDIRSSLNSLGYSGLYGVI